MTDAYVDSGVNAAVRAFAGQDAATRIAARPEIFVYPKPADADRFRNYYRDLSTCLSDLYKSGLPAGSTVDVQRVPKRGTGALGKGSGAQTVAYISTLKGADGTQLGKTAIAVVTARNRAASRRGAARVARPERGHQDRAGRAPARPGIGARPEVAVAGSLVAEVRELQRDVEVVVAHRLDRGLEVVALLAA